MTRTNFFRNKKKETEPLRLIFGTVRIVIKSPPRKLLSKWYDYTSPYFRVISQTLGRKISSVCLSFFFFLKNINGEKYFLKRVVDFQLSHSIIYFFIQKIQFFLSSFQNVVFGRYIEWIVLYFCNYSLWF